VATFARDAHLREALLSALRSMSAESRIYKGLADRFPELIAWIERIGIAISAAWESDPGSS